MSVASDRLPMVQIPTSPLLHIASLVQLRTLRSHTRFARVTPDESTILRREQIRERREEVDSMGCRKSASSIPIATLRSLHERDFGIVTTGTVAITRQVSGHFSSKEKRNAAKLKSEVNRIQSVSPGGAAPAWRLPAGQRLRLQRRDRASRLRRRHRRHRRPCCRRHRRRQPLLRRSGRHCLRCHQQ
ncbi:hypothetical protein SAMN04489842_0514 [Natronobacterium texcoconense]|uniref:Uncharacterized protein n=1 Tax=Natronobacterium texcoconense TaxID=1095778 RepID=A0A1H1A0S8_NATTX|nr:hypothetical protein SAMN04489842_0514 [Natronobacterium texcoconense]